VIVGVLRVELRLAGARSLKDKRRVVQSLLDRARREYRVAAAEVDQQDSWRRATLGFACVSAAADHAAQILSRVTGLIERETRVELIDYAIEIL
jgi:uncharacterized protein YlxP (DUF503 family)